MKGWRTMALGGAAALFGFLQGFDFTTVISDPNDVAKITGVIGLAVMVLRYLTTGPVGTKE